MYRRVAVAVDGSPGAAQLVELAAGLLPFGAGRLDLVHVHTDNRPGEALEALPIYGWEQIVEYDDEIDAESAAAEEAELRERVRRLGRERNITAELHLLRGPIGETLAQHARLTSPDLFVAATQVHRRRRGSITGALVRHGGVPVLLVRTEAHRPGGMLVRRILVALDGTDFSAAILPPVMELARATGARISLVRVIPEGMSFFRPEGGTDPESYLQGIAERFPDDLPPPLPRTRAHDDPAAALLHEAQSGYDLIALATHGWSTPREWFLGSTAATLLARTSLPMLAFHPTGVHALAEAAHVY